ncbi:MAG: DNA integrity scanning protein DisA nucleotide-binding domain protein [Deltaproteobacteria bacterium]|nr:DNA integrity scanning protein DisA nucleotide-binding domain protein [Deltaproteobacteria bacterium]
MKECSQSVNRFVSQCVSDTLNGLRDGLSHFSGPSRAAVIFCLAPESPIYICDPQHLLRGHETKFRSLYLEADHWRLKAPLDPGKSRFAHIQLEKNLQLAGLISFGGRSGSVFYQMWFTEHHPDICSVGPTERWLEHTALRLSHDIANGCDLYTGISGTFLREYATHAIRDQVVDEMNLYLGWDAHIRVYPVLDAILGISKTREEGAWPRGELLFVEPRFLPQMAFLARFRKSEQPRLDNLKHVRKLLLSVEQSDHKLVSDGKAIIGISDGKLPKFSIRASFFGRHGFLKVNQDTLCSFEDGSFKSTTRQAKLIQVEEALLESDLSPSEGNLLFRIIAEIVHNAEEKKFGCTLIIDLNSEPVSISGQALEAPLDLSKENSLELTKSLSKVDGAVHIGADRHLHGFACLLDGRAISGEDRARGARFNSALRFSAEHANIIVVVVSSDRPVSVIQNGVAVNSQCSWDPVDCCIFTPETLENWIAASDA